VQLKTSLKSIFFWGAIASFVLAVAIATAAVWDGFFKLGQQAQIIEAPGFHVLDLETPGVYAGVYQHRGNGPMPVEDLSRLDVHVMSKETYQEVPVMMNKSGQILSKFGTQGMVVFNFLTDKPGFYTLSAVYSGAEGPPLSLVLLPQAVENLRPMLAAGGVFFLIFVGLGVYLIRQGRRF
jgi:hypothetical protein